MTTLRALVCVCVCVCAKRQQKKQKNTQHTAKKSTYFLMTSLKTLLLRGFCCCCRCSLSLSLTPSWARVCVCTRVARCAGNLLKSRGVQPNKYLCIKQQSKRIEVRTLKLQIRFEWHRAKVSYLFALFGRTPQNTHAHLSTAANWCDKLAARTHTTLSRSLSLPFSLALTACCYRCLRSFFYLQHRNAFLLAAKTLAWRLSNDNVRVFHGNAIVRSDLLIKTVFAQKSFAYCWLARLVM